jgi:hypothetical protein
VRLRGQRGTTQDKDHESTVEQTLNNSVFRTLSISAGKMKELQGQDNVLSQIIDYLENLLERRQILKQLDRRNFGR